MTVVVIGSGPAGAAAAQALCDAGIEVVALDAGDRVERGRMEPFDALGQIEPDGWPAGLAERVRGVFPVTAKRAPLKPVYGSLFAYAHNDPDLPMSQVNTEALSSLALGGLSNAWGAAMLPYRQTDIEDWPIRLNELRPHYEAVLRFVPLAAEHDELSATLPLYTDTPVALRPGSQTQVILTHMRRHAQSLTKAGITFGSSRLAVVAGADDPHRCRQCGMCLYGCPYGSIYNSSWTLEQLARAGKVDYRAGIYVDRVQQVGDHVEIDFHDRRRPGSRGHMTASRVLIACGAISSTRLVLESMGRERLTREMQDSLYFMIPMLTYRAATPVTVATQGNTLAKVFVELENTGSSRHGVHLQIYGYNDIVLSALARHIPLRPSRLEHALRALVERMVLVQGYMHSHDSPKLEIACEGGGVRLTGEDTQTGAERVKKIVRRLFANGRLLGLALPPGFIYVGRPGKSNHLGGSLPMRARPEDLETDRLGRLRGWDRIHVVDASVLPSIPATTVTFSVMANAHRIAATTSAIENQTSR